MCFDALNTVIDVARRMSTKRGDSLMNRMMFGHLISIWETCLGDLLILEIKKHPDCLVEFVTADEFLSKRKFSKGDFSPDNPLVREEVFEYLQSIVYHNFKRVQGLYKNALKVEFLPDEEQQVFMQEVVMLRHDCVHRNGFTRDGDKLDVFTFDFLCKVANAAWRSILQVYRPLSTREYDTWASGELLEHLERIPDYRP